MSVGLLSFEEFLFEDEGYFEVYFVSCDFVVFDDDFLVIDLGIFDVVDCLSGFGNVFVDGVFEVFGGFGCDFDCFGNIYVYFFV